ncbi:hypothetical protein [Chryseobacterium sp. JK1]|uniref:hypothetical protein n=1 Tax=Chryseobacterium sp. JK1 TaxID=874294 RepID=UPI003D68645C
MIINGQKSFTVTYGFSIKSNEKVIYRSPKVINNSSAFHNIGITNLPKNNKMKLLSVIFLLFFANSSCQNIRNKVFFGIPIDDNDLSLFQKDKIIINLPNNMDGRFITKDNSNLNQLLDFLKNTNDKRLKTEVKISYCHSNVSPYNLKISESLKKSLEIILQNNNIIVNNIIANGCKDSFIYFSDEAYKKMAENNIEITIL